LLISLPIFIHITIQSKSTGKLKSDFLQFSFKTISILLLLFKEKKIFKSDFN